MVWMNGVPGCGPHKAKIPIHWPFITKDCHPHSVPFEWLPLCSSSYVRGPSSWAGTPLAECPWALWALAQSQSPSSTGLSQSEPPSQHVPEVSEQQDSREDVPSAHSDGQCQGRPLTSRSSACDSTNSCWLSIFLLLQAVHYLICLFVYFNLLNFLVIYGDRMRWAKAEQEGSRGTNWFTHSFIHVFIFASSKPSLDTSLCRLQGAHNLVGE